MFRLSAVLLMLGIGCLEFGYIVGECANGIRSFLEVEAVLVKHLESYLDKLEIEQNTISSYLNDIDNLHEQIDLKKYCGNPINAFLTISRFVNIWKHEILDVLLTNNTYNEYINAIARDLDKKNLNGQWSTTVDLLNATDNLLFMQQSEDIPTSELANEVLLTDMHSGKNVTLSASECYAIGRNLNQLEHYEHAAQWLLQARKRLSLDSSRFPEVSKVLILEQLAVTYKKLDNVKLSYKINNDILKREPNNKAALNNKSVLQKELVLERIRLSKVTVDE